LSKEKPKSVKELLDNMINVEIPAVMQEIMVAKDVAADVKAARVGLASTGLHHLRLLRAAFE